MNLFKVPSIRHGRDHLGQFLLGALQHSVDVFHRLTLSTADITHHQHSTNTRQAQLTS